MQIIVLTVPMLIAQSTQVGMGFIDTVMAGQISESDLAAVGLGSSIFFTFFVTLLGIPAALSPILSQLFGAKNKTELAESARQGIWLSFVIGLIAMVLMILLTSGFKSFLKLDEYTLNTTILYVIGVSIGMPAAIMHKALHAYASSLNRPQPIMWISLVAMLLNIPLNYILIYGLLGFPKLGGAGCGFATGAIFWFNTLVLWIYITKSQYFKSFGLTDKFSWPNWSYFKKILNLGFPISVSFFLEVSLFSFIVWLIANSGVAYIAAQQIIIVVISITYLIPQTLGVATSVRVGQAIGANERLKARYISGLGLFAGLLGACFTAFILVVFREPIMSLFTDSAKVIEIGVNILLLAAMFQFVDSLQTIASSALRGYKITKIPMIIHAVAFWLVGLGFGYILAFNYAYGIYGFWIALVLSLSVAAIALTYYLDYISKAFLKRKSFMA